MKSFRKLLTLTKRFEMMNQLCKILLQLARSATALG